MTEEHRYLLVFINVSLLWSRNKTNLFFLLYLAENNKAQRCRIQLALGSNAAEEIVRCKVLICFEWVTIHFHVGKFLKWSAVQTVTSDKCMHANMQAGYNSVATALRLSSRHTPNKAHTSRVTTCNTYPFLHRRIFYVENLAYVNECASSLSFSSHAFVYEHYPLKIPDISKMQDAPNTSVLGKNKVGQKQQNNSK